MILNAYPYSVVATIAQAVSPADRRASYADPIDATLTAAGLGTVTGGGSQLDASGAVTGSDIDVALANLDDALDTLRESLRELGAPAGSVLTFTRDGATKVIAIATGEPVRSEPGAIAAHRTRVADTDVLPRAAQDTTVRRQLGTAGEWSVTTVEMAVPNGGVLSFDALIQYALDQGVSQVAAAGSPLNPFLVYDTGRAHFFVCLAGDGDPMEIALQTLQRDDVQPAACALVLDSRLTLASGGKTDAIVVMASQRAEPEGVTWAQTYRPKGIFRSFKALPFREQVATSLSLFDAARSPA